jgi:hypothetical protein
MFAFLHSTIRLLLTEKILVVAATSSLKVRQGQVLDWDEA